MALRGKKGQMGVLFTNIKDALVKFFSFIGNKLRNYPSLSWGEQIAYAAVGVGILLVLIAIILFAW